MPVMRKNFFIVFVPTGTIITLYVFQLKKMKVFIPDGINSI
jgi:hypothetical protein